MTLKAVFLDFSSLNQGDLDIQALKTCFSRLDIFEETEEDDVVHRLQNADVAITNKVVLTQSQLIQLPQLKLILISATGINNVDLQAAKAQQIIVCNCQAYGTNSVAQHTMALMLALATQIVNYHQAAIAGKWQQSQQFCLLDYPIVELSGKTLGIIGYGELGQAVAKLAQAFGMQIKVAQLPNRPKQSNYISLDELLPQVDFLSLHCPLTQETQNLIDAYAFSRMKPSAFLINCARGGIVNEEDLAHALRSKQIAGAAMDVLSVEPPTKGNMLLDPTLTNLIITPHSAWGSVQARQRIIDQLVENMQAFNNKQPIRQVN